jgi:integrase
LSWAAIGHAMNCSDVAAANWRKRFRDLWDSSYQAAMEKVCDEVRQIAGTPKMLAAFDEFIDAAEAADRWAIKQGKPLFAKPSLEVTNADGGNHTIGSFFEAYYLAACLSQASEETIYLYRKQIRKWELLTGNPPLRAITSETLVNYRAALIAQRSRWKHRRPLSLWTVRGHLQAILTLIGKAGPAGPRNRDAAGFIAHQPWTKKPWAELPVPKVVTAETLSKCYEAAGLMDVPTAGRVKPGSFWRALLVVAYNLGLRRRALFGLRWRDVDFRTRLITVPAEINKSRRRLVVPMNAVVVAHLKAIQRQPEDSVFDCWWTTKEGFRVSLYKLQRLAGLSNAERFQLHRLRKTCATILWQQSPGAAQLMLGHRSISITRDHYTNAPAALTGAADAMPQPDCFRNYAAR